MNQQIVSALQKIINEYGTDIFDDSRRVGALLNDFLQGKHEGERRLLLLILNKGIPKRMMQGHSFSDAELRSHATHISKKYHSYKTAVVSALKCWQKVLSSQELWKPPTSVQKEAEAALKSLCDKAEHGTVEAQFELGRMYEQGRSIPKDEAQAVYWYQKAAEQGYAEAQFRLGLMYEEGWGVPKDEAQAVYWYQEAAEQGYAEAQCNCAWLFENGLGCHKNKRLALQLYRKAAAQGLPEAEAARQGLALEGYSVERYRNDWKWLYEHTWHHLSKTVILLLTSLLLFVIQIVRLYNTCLVFYS